MWPYKRHWDCFNYCFISFVLITVLQNESQIGLKHKNISYRIFIYPVHFLFKFLKMSGFDTFLRGSYIKKWCICQLEIFLGTTQAPLFHTHITLPQTHSLWLIVVGFCTMAAACRCSGFFYCYWKAFGRQICTYTNFPTMVYSAYSYINIQTLKNVGMCVWMAIRVSRSEMPETTHKSKNRLESGYIFGLSVPHIRV